MSSGKKKGRTRVSIGTPTKLNHRKNSSEVCSPRGAKVQPHLSWDRCCSNCSALTVKQPDTVCDVCCCQNAHQHVCCIRNGYLVAAEWQLDNIEPAPPAVGLGSSQPPRWPCVCVLATETLLALRLFCGDWVMVKQLHSTSSSVGWRTTARAWSPALQCSFNQPYRVPLTAFRVTGSCAPVLPVDEGVSGQPLAVVVPVAGRCVPARGVSLLVEPCSTCDAVSFVGQIGFRKHVHHMLSGFVVAVGCGYRLAYLGSFLRLMVTDVTADSVKGNQCSDDSGVASSPITKQLSSLLLADGGGD